MNKNKIKKSANFVFWLGLSPILIFLSTILFIVVFATLNNNQQVSLVSSTVIYDTVYVECLKKHCDDFVITPVKIKTKQKKIDTLSTLIVEETENIDTTKKN